MQILRRMLSNIEQVLGTNKLIVKSKTNAIISGLNKTGDIEFDVPHVCFIFKKIQKSLML